MTSIVPSEHQEDIPMCLMSEFPGYSVGVCTLCLTPRNCEDVTMKVLYELLDTMEVS